MRHIKNLSAALLTSLLLITVPAHSRTVELALVLDGSGSITSIPWEQQWTGYRNVLSNDFFTNFATPRGVEEIWIASYTFSGYTIDATNTSLEELWGNFEVFNYLEWTPIRNNEEAAAFGARFENLPQPRGQTATATALNVAAFGGPVGCPDLLILGEVNCDGVVNRPGIVNNGIDSDVQIIDISTDGFPTRPNSDGFTTIPPSPENIADRNLAIDAADAARGEGIFVNAIGVFDPEDQALDADFLMDLVSGTPQGFFLTADSFDDFEPVLEQKLSEELSQIPVPAALPLFLSALAGLGLWRRRNA